MVLMVLFRGYVQGWGTSHTAVETNAEAWGGSRQSVGIGCQGPVTLLESHTCALRGVQPGPDPLGSISVPGRFGGGW